MTYTDLIFDLYGTLVDIRTVESAAVWKKTALFFGYHGVRYTGPALKAAFHAAMAAREAAAGQSYECFPDIPCEQVMEQLFLEKGVEENAHLLGIQAAQLFRIASTRYIRLYPGVPEALEALRKRGVRLWLLSNAQRVFTAFELRHLGLERYFDGIYLSSDYGCRKPDNRFYRALLEEQKLLPEKSLMIGNDRNTDIAGAKALGMGTLYLHANITPPGQAEADPTLDPEVAPATCRHFEIEGTDWHAILPKLQKILP